MKRENIIDMSAYFLRMQEAQEERKTKGETVKNAVYHVAGILETAATVGISLGFCVCTFLFFVIL